MGRAVIYMLDTNTCIYIINQRPPQVRAHFEGLRYGAVVVSSITGAELAFGVAKSGSPRNQDALENQLAAPSLKPSSLAERTLCRQPPEVGAECVNRACSDLCGGRSAMGVPTAIPNFARKCAQGFSRCRLTLHPSLADLLPDRDLCTINGRNSLIRMMFLHPCFLRHGSCSNIVVAGT